jgi:hypothetical protein
MSLTKIVVADSGVSGANVLRGRPTTVAPFVECTSPYPSHSTKTSNEVLVTCSPAPSMALPSSSNTAILMLSLAPSKFHMQDALRSLSHSSALAAVCIGQHALHFSCRMTCTGTPTPPAATCLCISQHHNHLLRV